MAVLMGECGSITVLAPVGFGKLLGDLDARLALGKELGHPLDTGPVA
jgi:hypothetical protein